MFVIVLSSSDKLSDGEGKNTPMMIFPNYFELILFILFIFIQYLNSQLQN